MPSPWGEGGTAALAVTDEGIMSTLFRMSPPPTPSPRRGPGLRSALPKEGAWTPFGLPLAPLLGELSRCPCATEGFLKPYPPLTRVLPLRGEARGTPFEGILRYAQNKRRRWHGHNAVVAHPPTPLLGRGHEGRPPREGAWTSFEGILRYAQNERRGPRRGGSNESGIK